MTDVDDNKQTVVAFYARVFADNHPADAVAKYIGSEYFLCTTDKARWSSRPSQRRGS
jgi:hypothetical protein